MQGTTFSPTPSNPIPVVLGDYIDYWLVAFKLGVVKEGTYCRLKEERRVLDQYQIVNMPVKEITYMDIKAYLNELVEHGYALSSVKKQLTIVTAPLKFAAANHWILTDPTYGIRLPSRTQIRKPTKEISVYEGKDYLRLRSLLETERHDAYRAALLMLELGLRPGEVIALDWSDINWQRRCIHIHKTYVKNTETGKWFVQDEPKTMCSNRLLPISSFALQMLKRMREVRNDLLPFVFSSVDKTRMSYESLRYQCAMACRKINIVYKGLHVFRHTFATQQYYKGCDVKILSKLLGHSNVSITYNTYIHLYGDALDEMRAVLG